MANKKIIQKGKAQTGNDNKAEGLVFSKQNFIWMFVGLAFIFVGFFLMTGPDANTINGIYDPNSWNNDIFSFRRIRLAPFLVVLGFAIEVYAILSNSKKTL